MNDTNAEARRKDYGFRSDRERTKFEKLREAVIGNASTVSDNAKQLEGDGFYTKHEFTIYILSHIHKPKNWRWAAIVAAISFEAYINYGSFLETFRVPGWAIAFAGLTAVVVCWASEEHGKLIRQKTRGLVLTGKFRRKHGEKLNSGVKPAFFWLITAFAVTALIGIIYARYGVLYAQHVDSGYVTAYWGKVAVAALLNILAWVIGAAASYVAHSDGICAPTMTAFLASVKKLEKSRKIYEDKFRKIKNSQEGDGGGFEKRVEIDEGKRNKDRVSYKEALELAEKAISDIKKHAQDLNDKEQAS